MWVPKKGVLQLPTWEGDAVFLKLLLDNEEKFFTLKLIYEDEKLVEKIFSFIRKSENCKCLDIQE